MLFFFVRCGQLSFYPANDSANVGRRALRTEMHRWINGATSVDIFPAASSKRTGVKKCLWRTGQSHSRGTYASKIDWILSDVIRAIAAHENAC